MLLVRDDAIKQKRMELLQFLFHIGAPTQPEEEVRRWLFLHF